MFYSVGVGLLAVLRIGIKEVQRNYRQKDRCIYIILGNTNIFSVILPTKLGYSEQNCIYYLDTGQR